MRSDIFTIIDDINLTLTSVDGDEIDISRSFLSIDIFESVFNPFMNGKISMVDTYDIIKNYPIVGGEVISIDLFTEDYSDSVTMEFVVYKISKDKVEMRGDEKSRVIELFICSKEAIKNGLVKISKKLSGKPEDIIIDILDNTLLTTKPILTTSAADDVEVFSNFWSPTRCINFITKISKTTEYMDYIFFESLGGFIFKPLSQLLSLSGVNDIVFDASNESFIGNVNMKMFKFKSYFDLIDSISNGQMGATLYRPHESDYIFTKNEATIHDNSDRFVTNGSNLYYPSDIGSESNMIDSSYYDTDISQVRMASFKLLSNYNLNARLNGDFSRKAGDTINMSFPSLDNQNPIHDNFDGVWFLSEIRHTISQNNHYVQNVSMVKNSFFNNSKLPGINSLKNI